MSQINCPQELVVVIDCMQQFRLSIQLEGEQLGVFYISTKDGNYYSDEQSLLLEQLDWDCFLDEIDEIGLWQWKPAYRSTDSHCQWGLQIRYSDKEVISECIQDADDSLPLEDQMLFKRLLRAIGSLVGQDFIQLY